MIRERPTQRRFLSFRGFTMLFLLLLVGALAPGELIATAELPFGLTPSDEQSPSIPSVITISALDLPATQTQGPSRSMSASGGFQNCAITMTTISIQDPVLRKASCE